MKLICFTYAGGHKYSYRNFIPYINDEVEIITMELPGRGTRITEPLLDDMNAIVADVYSQIQDYICDNYMFYGHSMGAILGNLILHKLNNEKRTLPKCFLATGCSSPLVRGLKNKIHNLEKSLFKQKIVSLGGLPQEIIDNQELLDFVFPILRSDIKAIETNIYVEDTRYDVPIKVLCGLDENITFNDIKDWEQETSSTFDYEFLEGNHFFILNHKKIIANMINNQFLKTAITN